MQTEFHTAAVSSISSNSTSRRRRKLTAVLATAALLLVGVAALIPAAAKQNPFGRGGTRPDPRVLSLFMQIRGEVEEIQDELKLTPAQRQAIETTLIQIKPQAEALQATLKAQRDVLQAQLVSNPSDTAAINRSIDAINSTKVQATRLGITTTAQVAVILTPQQRQAVSTHLDNIEALVGQLRDVVREKNNLAAIVEGIR